MDYETRVAYCTPVATKATDLCNLCCLNIGHAVSVSLFNNKDGICPLYSQLEEGKKHNSKSRVQIQML